MRVYSSFCPLIQTFLLVAVLFGIPSTSYGEDTSTQTPPQAVADALNSKHLKAVGAMRAQVRNVWAGNSLRLGTTAIHVVDTQTGKELYSVHANLPLNPASNVKLVSTATVLSTLGPDWRFQTKVVGPAPDSDGVVSGGIYLLGNYDPTLGPGGLQGLAKMLAERGVKEIHGNIVTSESGLRDSLANKRLRITLTGRAPGKRPIVDVWPQSDFATIETNTANSRRRGRTNIRVASRLVENEGESPRLKLSVRGSIRSGHKRIIHVLAQRRTEFTASVFARALKDSGIDLLGKIEYASFDDFSARKSQSSLFSETLAVHESTDIGTLVSRVNKRSLNYLADRLIMSAARTKHQGELNMESAVQLMKEWLTGIGIPGDSVVLDTGSGLSYRTELSTKQIVTILRAGGGYGAAVSPSSSEKFRKSLSIGGSDGTLRSRFKNPGVRLSGRVIGKTGTLRSVIALSGFLTHPSGRALTFSIVTNGHENHLKRNVRLAHEHIVGKLDTFLRKPGSQIPQAAELSPLWTKEAKPASEAVRGPFSM